MRRNISLIPFVTIVFSYSCGSTKNVGCDRFRIGRFETHSETDNSKTIIERNDSLQTEKNLETGNVTTARILWTSKCEYELFYISSSKDSIATYIKTHALKNVILQRNKDYYIAKSTVDGLSMTLIDTVRVAK